ncbi:MAG: hypothetical protein V2A77_10100 [Pseudomonadota bacterium]
MRSLTMERISRENVERSGFPSRESGLARSRGFARLPGWLDYEGLTPERVTTRPARFIPRHMPIPGYAKPFGGHEEDHLRDPAGLAWGLVEDDLNVFVELADTPLGQRGLEGGNMGAEAPPAPEYVEPKRRTPRQRAAPGRAEGEVVGPPEGTIESERARRRGKTVLEVEALGRSGLAELIERTPPEMLVLMEVNPAECLPKGVVLRVKPEDVPRTGRTLPADTIVVFTTEDGNAEAVNRELRQAGIRRVFHYQENLAEAGKMCRPC